jgi:hypothetical protein
MSAMRMCSLVLAGLLLTALPGCHYVPKPPRPNLVGPDTGWTHAPTAFTVTFSHHSGDWVTLADFDWGDSSMTTSVYNLDDAQTHVYAEPGMYLVKCQLWNLYSDEFTDVRKIGDWSNTCTVHIVTGAHAPLGPNQRRAPHNGKLRDIALPEAASEQLGR